MKRIFAKVALAIILFSLLPISNANSSDVCGSLNQSFVANDSLTVTVTSTSIIEKSGSFQLSVSYRLHNQSKDKKINEGYFEVEYSDGTKEWKGNRYFEMFPNDLFERTYTWEYLKTIRPLVLVYRGRDDIGQRTSLGLHWPVLNENCSSLEALRVAKEKAAAELKAKQEAEAKAIADKAAADAVARAAADAAKAAADKAAAAKAPLLKKSTITCVKGKLTKKVTAIKPVCPAGYKKK